MYIRQEFRKFYKLLQKIYCVSTFHVLCQLSWLTICLLFSINNLIHLTVTICILLACCICVDMSELSEISYTVYEEDLMLPERL